MKTSKTKSAKAAQSKTVKDKTAKDISQDPAPNQEVTPGVVYLTNFPKNKNAESISSLYLDQCRELFAPFAQMAKEKLIKVSSSSPYAMRNLFAELETPRGFDKMKKDSFSQLYISLSDHLSNFLAIAMADKRYQLTWERIINNLEVYTIDLKAQLGREIKIVTDYYWSYRAYIEALFSPCIVTAIWRDYNRETKEYHYHGRISLFGNVRRRLATLFFGESHASPHLTPTLPEDAHLTIDNFETSVVTDLMTLDGIALNGQILSANGSISAAPVKKIRNQSTIKDFSTPESKWPTDRIEMLCLTYFTLLTKISKKESVDVKKLVRFAVDEMPKLIKGPIFNTFLPAHQGFTKNWTSESYVIELTTAIRSILIQATEWLNLDNFKMLLFCTDASYSKAPCDYLKLFPESDRNKSSLVRRVDKENYDDPDWEKKEIDWFEEIGWKFSIHWMKYLCALGIVELAIDSNLKDIEADTLEGIRYVKLTPLGQYAFRIVDTYTPTKTESGSDVEYDALNNIITLDAKSPFMMFLSKITKRISPTRLRISRASLINGCATKEELDQRIKNLSLIIDPIKEPSLQKIIDEALHHTDCAERDGGYSMLKLRPDLPELRQLILNDKELREMTIMATNSLVLVKTTRLERFYTVCASHGFLMR